LTIFVFIPIVTSFQLSLNRVAPFGSQMIYVGFENYSRLINDPDYWNTLKVSLLFTLGTVPTGIFLAVGLAILLSYPLKHLTWLHRLLIFLPIVISTAVTGVLFRWLYHPVVGYVNYGLSLVGIDGPGWLTSKEWALAAVILAVVWRQLGFNVIIALAGIQNIDETYYEAAKVDGANLWHRIRHITLPLLSPTLFFLLMINVINSLQTFGEINILTDGGPGQATMTMLYSIYVDAFIGTPLRGYASAQAYLLFILILVMSFIQFKVVSGRVHYQ
ncbi:MAG TPA: sugar ABC transporter permease, partial [Anaerolineales bacterium]|nr:sugar ABC transporter permease [Anaerolineales bacterium]